MIWHVNFNLLAIYCHFFSFLTKLAIKFHTNPYVLPVKWSAREPRCPLQRPRDLVCGTVIVYYYSFTQVCCSLISFLKRRTHKEAGHLSLTHKYPTCSDYTRAKWKAMALAGKCITLWIYVRTLEKRIFRNIWKYSNQLNKPTKVQSSCPPCGYFLFWQSSSKMN